MFSKRCFLIIIIFILGQQAAWAEKTAAEIDAEADVALEKLYASAPGAVELSKGAKGILIFPRVWKAGLVLGGKFGKGVLRENGKSVAYYNTAAGSYGLQAGVQAYGFALFFMTDKSLDYLKKSKGWEIGVGPSIVVVDKGAARSLTTSTAQEPIYAFFVDQKGLMAGIGIEGSKITQINPK